MLRILVLLACGFLLAESRVLQKRTDDSCERLVECSTALENLYLEDEDLPSYLSSPDEADLDRFCERKSELDPCFEAARDECDNQEFVDAIDAAVTAAGYICSDRGRQATLALAESECSVDDTKQQQLSQAIQSCLDDFEFDVVMLTSTVLSEHRDLQPSELCPFASSWVECTVAAAETTCGDEYATFVSDILQASAGLKFEKLSCDDVTNDRRAIVKKALDALGKSQLAARSISSQRKRDDVALLRPGKREDGDATLLRLHV